MTTILPLYFRIFLDCKVVLCTECEAYYTLNNSGRHLVEKHRIKGKQKNRIFTLLAVKSITLN
jgi:hypothetical protein